jgi:glycosyltransferase involved in cell wall biosynthesis
MKPLRVLLVISTKGWGGTEAYVSLLEKGLLESGNLVWIACHKKGQIAQPLKKQPHLSINLAPQFYVWSLLKVVLFVLFHRIEIIHGNSGKDYWLVFLAGLLTFRKVILTRHLMAPFSNHTQKMALIKAEKIIAPARVTFDVLSRSGIPEEKLALIYNGIDPEPFKIPHGKYRALYRLPEKGFVTGIISNLHYPKGKGHFTLIESIPEIRARIPDALWIIGGTGPLLPELVQSVKRLKVEDCVIFTGHLYPHQVPHVLSCLDLFILLSYDNEGGCPLSIMEAMASGLPVIASLIGGNTEIVKHEKTGYLIKPEDTQSLIQYSLFLYENQDKRKSMGEEGKKSIQEFFNYKRMAEETAGIYGKDYS